MKKIAVFVYDITLFGGAERVAVNLANELVKCYDVSMISCFNCKTGAAFPLKKNVKEYVLSEKLESMALHCYGLSNVLKKIIIHENIDVILNITAGVNTISYMATHRLSTKVIYCEHSNLFNKTYGKKHQFRQWIGAKTADKVITLTELDKNEFEKKYRIEGKVDYIYNWFDGTIYDDYNENSKKIISVGRLEYIKGYDRLVQVAQKVMSKHSDWLWEIYGEGSYRKKIQEDIDKYNLHDQVVLKGNDPKVMDKYKEYSFCVMTSYYEGFALALLEAMSNSLPAVSFDCPTGPREIITEGVNGFLIEDGCIDKMAEAINTLIEDKELRRSFAANAPRVVAKFNKEKISEQWIEVIDSLV